MKKKELEQKIAELEKRNEELGDTLIRGIMNPQVTPCGLQHYPSPQIYPIYPNQPWNPNTPVIWSYYCQQQQAQVMPIEMQNEIASHTYNFPSGQ